VLKKKKTKNAFSRRHRQKYSSVCRSAGDRRRRRLLRSVHRTVQTVRGGPYVAVPTRVPQELRRPLAVGAPHLPDVQNGHTQTLRVLGEWTKPNVLLNSTTSYCNVTYGFSSPRRCSGQEGGGRPVSVVGSFAR